MKYLILALGMLISLNIQAQERKTDKKNVETSFTVKGVCGMCKDRIEDAALRTSGVKLAEWNKTTKELKVIYNSKRTSEKEIQKAVALKGHATDSVAQDSVAYSKLPDCCRYADGANCSH